MTTTRVGDTDIYVEYWSPQERTRSDDVADMLRRLRARIAEAQEALVPVEPEPDFSAAVEAAEKSQDWLDALERDVYAKQAAHDAGMAKLKEQLQRRRK